MNKDIVMIAIFAFCIITIIIDSNTQKPTELFPLYLLLLGGSITYVGIFVTYVLLVRGYKLLKKHLYDDFLEIIRDAIKGHSKFSKDFVRAYAFCVGSNLLILYFISVTPISEILSHIPGLQITDLDELKFSLLSFDILRIFGTNFTAFPFTSLGTITLFILRCLHRNPINQKDGKYPGSRVILGFSYTVIAIMLITGSIAFEKAGFDKDEINNSDFSKSFSLPMLFTFFNFFSVFVFIFADRYLISRSFFNKS